MKELQILEMKMNIVSLECKHFESYRYIIPLIKKNCFQNNVTHYSSRSFFTVKTKLSLKLKVKKLAISRREDLSIRRKV